MGESVEVGLVVSKVLVSPWRPAQRYWNVFQVLDPVGIGPVRIREPGVLKRLAAEVTNLKVSRPSAPADLGEKIKVAASLGLWKVARVTAVDGPESDLALSRNALRHLISCTGDEVIRLWTGAIDIIEDAGNMRLAILHGLVEIAGDTWISTLRADGASLSLNCPLRGSGTCQ